MPSLYEELTTGALSGEIAQHIAAGNDGAILAILNRKDITITSVISANSFAIWAAATGMRATIQDHAENIASPLRSIALTLLDLLTGNLDRELDLSNAANVTMLNAWVTAGAITTLQRDELLAMAKKHISRAEQMGIIVDIPSIASALRG